MATSISLFTSVPIIKPVYDKPQHWMMCDKCSTKVRDCETLCFSPTDTKACKSRTTISCEKMKETRLAKINQNMKKIKVKPKTAQKFQHPAKRVSTMICKTNKPNKALSFSLSLPSCHMGWYLSGYDCDSGII